MFVSPIETRFRYDESSVEIAGCVISEIPEGAVTENSDSASNHPCSKAAVRLDAILQSCFAGRARAMDAAIDFPVGFHTVPHDPAIAVRAYRRERMDRAFKAIECVMLSGYDHFKRLVIFIFANFACSHTQFFRASAALRRCAPLLLRE